MTRRPLLLAAGALAVAGCGDGIDATPVDDHTAAARRDYPDLAHLYGGDQGIYRGCSPNGGVCHNSNEFPNLDSLGAIVDNIGRPCNQKRERPDELHDMCERRGDSLRVGGLPYEIGAIGIDDPSPIPRRFTVSLRGAPAVVAPPLRIERDGALLYDLGADVAGVDRDPRDPSGATLRVELATEVMSPVLARSGVVADPAQIQLGDPNRDGVFGADLGAGIIVPGDPHRSYLLRRLFDPGAGPLMPRANCCFWSKAAARAMWCWVAGLDADGANALAPIDYDRCPPSPTIELLYPEPGPGCESSGMCPVGVGSGEHAPTFPSIYTEVLVQKCSGPGCHDRDAAGHLDLRDEDTAFASLASRVIGGRPDDSLLMYRLDATRCQAPGCKRMPLDRPALTEDELARIRTWIAEGARRRP